MGHPFLWQLLSLSQMVFWPNEIVEKVAARNEKIIETQTAVEMGRAKLSFYNER